MAHAEQPAAQPASLASLVGFGESLLVYKAAGPASADTAPMLRSVGGAELNSCVALARLGAGAPPDDRPRTTYVSVLPAGPLGEVVLRAGRDAGVEMRCFVRSEGGEIGTMHVFPGNPAPHYQRLQSAFAHLEPATLDWGAALAGHAWLHLTGITPLLGAGPLRAWRDALAQAHAHGVSVALDVNHRPALGTFTHLWSLIRPELPRVRCLVLSESALEQLATLPTEQGGAGLASSPQLPHPATSGSCAAATEAQPASCAAERVAPSPGVGGGGQRLLPTYASRYDLLQQLRAAWGVAMVVCCFKTSEAAFAAGEGGRVHEGGDSTSTIKAGGNVRWSVVAHEGGLAGTMDSPTHHKPVQATGGGDAWLAGFVSAIPGGRAAQGAPVSGAGGPPRPSAAVLTAACRRGDLLAALSQSTDGDMSHASGADLAAAERRFLGKPAHLNGPAGNRGPVAAGPVPALVKAEEETASRLAAQGVLAVATLEDPGHAEGVIRALAAGGVRCVELMLRTPAALQALSSAVEAASRLRAEGGPDMCVGAGTVLTEAQVDEAVAAGAAFLVAPGLCEPVVKRARALNVPMVPGVCTPSEIEKGIGLGCRLLKFFPAATCGGPKALAAFAAPYKDRVRFVPTGGVTADTMADYLARPEVMAVGGSWLVKMGPKPDTGGAAAPDLPATEAAARAAVQAASRRTTCGGGSSPSAVEPTSR
eukprot:CAMPEP_0185174530 /NCGR_PEP_ID=MMETSP1139-20130426/25365_1 /TAXON_ID=298111 /ORGANISM="Pavlova sp., Strain CCMP459" /LENGTH=705 /DNA_ID=CAMNT_0027740245 /DNA_START=98 /DNA_END=2215 /DNA_ORIENTATION=-